MNPLDECIIPSAPDTGFASMSTLEAVLPIVVVIAVVILTSAIYLIRTKRIRYLGKAGFLSLFAVTTLLAGLLTITSYASAQTRPLPDYCYDEPIAAVDDWLLPVPPAGGFPEGSPYLWGWTEYEGENGFRGSKSGGLLTSISQHVVGSNDTGKLDTNTVDLAPSLPGVQHEVIVTAPYSDENGTTSARQKQLWKYVYNPASDEVAVSIIDSSDVGLDTPEFEAALDNFVQSVGNGSWYMQSSDVRSFYTDYLNNNGHAAVNPNIIRDNDVSDQLYGYCRSSNNDCPGNRALGAYDVRIPYVVQSTDGTKSTGANIITRVAGISNTPE